MSNLHRRLQPRDEEIAAKVMDGEAIIINLANGIYYSMDKTGGLIWEMIQGRHSLEQTVTAVITRYDVSREQAERDIDQLIGELLQENLISVTEDIVAAVSEHQSEPEQKLSYELPKLNIYRDMGDLLALDPPTPGLGDTPWKDPDEEPFR